MMPMFVAILRRLCDDYIFIVTILRTRKPFIHPCHQIELRVLFLTSGLATPCGVILYQLE